jgi:hypothetical protein
MKQFISPEIKMNYLSNKVTDHASVAVTKVTQFESRSGYRPFWPRFLVDFLSLSRLISEWHLQGDHDRILLNQYLLITISSDTLSLKQRC